jgi:hypothetical protein
MTTSRATSVSAASAQPLFSPPPSPTKTSNLSHAPPSTDGTAPSSAASSPSKTSLFNSLGHGGESTWLGGGGTGVVRGSGGRGGGGGATVAKHPTVSTSPNGLVVLNTAGAGAGAGAAGGAGGVSPPSKPPSDPKTPRPLSPAAPPTSIGSVKGMREAFEKRDADPATQKRDAAEPASPPSNQAGLSSSATSSPVKSPALGSVTPPTMRPVSTIAGNNRHDLVSPSPHSSPAKSGAGGGGIKAVPRWGGAAGGGGGGAGGGVAPVVKSVVRSLSVGGGAVGGGGGGAAGGVDGGKKPMERSLSVKERAIQMQAEIEKRANNSSRGK